MDKSSLVLDFPPNNMDFKKKKEEIKGKFDELLNRIQETEANTQRDKEELMRLQGEYRLIEKMEKEQNGDKVIQQSSDKKIKGK